MNNISRIQKTLAEHGLDALLITDEKNQRYATGFAFTDGSVLVGREKAWLITDSRYIEAAEKIAGGCCAVQMFDREHSQLELLRKIADKQFTATVTVPAAPARETEPSPWCCPVCGGTNAASDAFCICCGKKKPTL